eukprot:COSAG05_NODE_5377_length_1193_cov_1.698355_1_plen_219_part_00
MATFESAAVASHSDPCEVLLVAMQSGDSGDSVVSVLEHGLEVLDSLTVARKDRKRVRDVCERVESMIERFDADGAAEQLSANEVSRLTGLSECLCAVESVRAGEAGMEYLEVVWRVLKELERCCDPVMGAVRCLKSDEAGERLRGLTVLRGLERVVQDEAVAVEVEMMSVVAGLAVDEGGSCAEREAAWMGLFALGFRNGEVGLCVQARRRGAAVVGR